MDLVFALAAFCAWTGMAAALGYAVRVRLERYRDRKRFERIWGEVKAEIEKLERRKEDAKRQQIADMLRQRNGRLQA